jgi:hypothetical protein
MKHLKHVYKTLVKNMKTIAKHMQHPDKKPATYV